MKFTSSLKLKLIYVFRINDAAVSYTHLTLPTKA